MKNHIALTLFSVVILTAGLSCSGQKTPDGMPKLYPCTVKVTQEGQPLNEVTILLVSKEPENTNWAVGGTTDANGVATIRTMGKYPGAPAGNFTVLLTKDEIVYKNPPKEVNGELVKGPFDMFSLIVPEQGDMDKSPHKIKIEQQNNHFDLDCGKKVRLAKPKQLI